MPVSLWWDFLRRNGGRVHPDRHTHTYSYQHAHGNTNHNVDAHDDEYGDAGSHRDSNDYAYADHHPHGSDVNAHTCTHRYALAYCNNGSNVHALAYSDK